MAETGRTPRRVPARELPGQPSAQAHLRTPANEARPHAPYGEVARDDDGRVCCHLCGRWFVALGIHVKVHGYTADAYRCAMGLLSSRGLVASPLCERICRRTRDSYQSTAEVRQDLAHRRRSGPVGPANPAPTRGAVAVGRAAQRVRDRQEQLAAGRATQEAVRRQQLAERLVALGASDLPSYLRAAYGAGGSLEALGRTTGLGRRRLREALIQAGVLIRPSGANTTAGKQARAHETDARAAERPGVSDLHAWLRDRRADGWTLQRVGEATGHSGHWVSWRLQATSEGDG